MMSFVFMGCSDKGLSFIVLYIIIFLVSVISGSGSAGRRKILVLHLIRSCREMEMKFLVRTLVSHQLLSSLQFTIFILMLYCMESLQKADCTWVPWFWSLFLIFISLNLKFSSIVLLCTTFMHLQYFEILLCSDMGRVGS